MMLDKETLERIGRYAVDAESLKFKKHEDLPRTVFVHAGNEVIQQPRAPAERFPQIETLESLLVLLGDERIAPDPEVYVDARGVYVVMDSEDRHEIAAMPFVLTTGWKALAETAREPLALSPRKAIKWLRMQVCGESVADVIRALSVVDFSRTGQSVHSTKHGGDSLGQSVEATVQGLEEIPESCELIVPVYLNEGVSQRYGIRVGVYLDTEAQRVEFFVLEDGHLRARDMVVRATVDKIRAWVDGNRKGVTVVQGAPLNETILVCGPPLGPDRT